MGLIVSIGAVVAVVAQSWTIFFVCAGVESFLLTLLYGCLCWNFRGVTIDGAKVQTHLDYYSATSCEDDAAFKERRLKDYKVGNAIFFAAPAHLLHVRMWLSTTTICPRPSFTRFGVRTTAWACSFLARISPMARVAWIGG